MNQYQRVEIECFCHICDKKLTFEKKEWIGRIEIEIKYCASCLDDQECVLTEAEDTISDLEDTIDNLEREIKKLRNQINQGCAVVPAQ